MLISRSYPFFRRALCELTLLSCLSAAASVRADDYFNPALLDIDGPAQSKADLSVYEKGPGIAPGRYQVTVFINNEQVEIADVNFIIHTPAHGNATLQPCFSQQDLLNLGIQVKAYPHLLAAGKCADLSAIPQATAKYQYSQQQLLLSIPQAALTQRPRGYISPDSFDEGINAGLLNYSFNGSQSKSRQQGQPDSSSHYLNLRPGLNLGAWRLRNYSTWSENTTGHSTTSDFSSVYTYAERDVKPIAGALMVGQSSSPSDVFDSVPFTGAQLASDDDMLPDSQRGFAPVIRGIAHSSAQVVVRQNGYVIYQNTVAPGAFTLTDLYPTGGSGDLNVTVKESDGSEQHFVVPYASVPILQREHHLKYSLTAGRYRSYDSHVEKTPFAQGTAIYGLPGGYTLYGGIQQSQHYQSQAFGAGKNLGDLGAFSVDVTLAKAQLKHSSSSTGQAWRVRYSKDIAATGTNFSVAGYRYNSAGFYTLSDTMDAWTSDDDWQAPSSRKSRSEATIDQPLGSHWGSLSVSLVNEHYWDNPQSMTSVSVGYNNNWHDISYSVTYSHNQNTGNDDSSDDSDNDDGNDNVITLNLSVPLDHWLPHTWATTYISTGKQDTTENIGLNGTALAGNNLNWSVQQGLDRQGAGASTALNADYKGTYGEVNAGFSRDDNQSTLSYGLQGGIVAHRNGITLGQPLGETVALVKAPGADNTRIENQTGVSTDFRGYAIVPYVSPWRNSTIALNTETLPANADITQSTQVVTPSRGAVVRATFHPDVGSRVLMTLSHNGALIPFGATVTSGDSTEQFIVSNGGEAYLPGLADSGVLHVRWGEAADQHCDARYQLPAASATDPIINASAQCR